MGFIFRGYTERIPGMSLLMDERDITAE
jgi:hypothetical protein